jgi:hypothetical protein
LTRIDAGGSAGFFPLFGTNQSEAPAPTPTPSVDERSKDTLFDEVGTGLGLGVAGVFFSTSFARATVLGAVLDIMLFLSALNATNGEGRIENRDGGAIIVPRSIIGPGFSVDRPRGKKTLP